MAKAPKLINTRYCDKCGYLRAHHSGPTASYIRADLVPQWQPIETAPKEAEALLLWDDAHLVPICGHWNDGRWENYVEDDLVHATHWMPFPDPPA